MAISKVRWCASGIMPMAAKSIATLHEQHLGSEASLHTQRGRGVCDVTRVTTGR